MQKIKIGLGRTFGTNDFGSVRADVSYETELDSAATPAEIEEAYKRARKLARKQLVTSLKTVLRIKEAQG